MSPTPPRILFVTARPPEDVIGGGGTATRNLIALLRGPPIGARVDVEPVRPRRPLLPHRALQAVAVARSAVSSLPSKTLFDLRPGEIGRIARRMRQGYDLIAINGGDLFHLAEFLPDGVPGLGVAHNVETSIYAGQTRRLRALPLIGRFFARDLRRFEAMERSGLARLGRVVCLSTLDAAALERLAPGTATLALPTGFAYPPYRRAPDRAVARPLRLGFLAKYGWWANAEAVEWLVREVLPGLADGAVRLLLFGPGAERFAGRHPAVEARGFVPDLAQVWGESDIVVCPMVSGSGINIKFIEAIYNNCPVLATSFARRGLPAFSDPAVVCLDSASEWIDFLAGPEADALARRSPDPATAELFSLRRGANRLAAFLAGPLGRDVVAP